MAAAKVPAESIRSGLVSALSNELADAVSEWRLASSRQTAGRSAQGGDAAASFGHVVLQLELSVELAAGCPATVGWVASLSLLHKEPSVDTRTRLASLGGPLLVGGSYTGPLESVGELRKGFPVRRVELGAVTVRHRNSGAAGSSMTMTQPPFRATGAVPCAELGSTFDVEASVTLADAATGARLGPHPISARVLTPGLACAAGAVGFGAEGVQAARTARSVHLLAVPLPLGRPLVALSAAALPVPSDPTRRKRPREGSSASPAGEAAMLASGGFEPPPADAAAGEQPIMPAAEDPSRQAQGIGAMPGIVWSRLGKEARSERLQEASEHLRAAGVSVAEGPRHRRVGVWDPLTGAVVTGDGAPKVKDAERFLARYPHLSVHQGDGVPPLRRGTAAMVTEGSLLSEAEAAASKRSKGVLFRVTKVQHAKRSVEPAVAARAIAAVLDFLRPTEEPP